MSLSLQKPEGRKANAVDAFRALYDDGGQCNLCGLGDWPLIKMRSLRALAQ
jgi:hypothetical protein